jgi:hypothetical protein
VDVVHALVDVEQATQKAAPDPIPPGTTLPQPGLCLLGHAAIFPDHLMAFARRYKRRRIGSGGELDFELAAAQRGNPQQADVSLLVSN